MKDKKKFFENIIIFGASGYVGQAIKKKFNTRKELIFVSRDNPEDINIDLSDTSQFLNLSINSQTILVFLAAISSPDICTLKYDSSFNLNVEKTSKLIEFVLEKNIN